MTLTYTDRVKEKTSTTGTGSFALTGSPAGGFITFLTGIGNGNSCRYVCTDGTKFEVGSGVLSGGTTLSRDTIFASFDGSTWGTSKQSFASGATVSCTLPANDVDLIVPLTKGGTGQVTAAASFDALTIKATDVASATTTNIGAAAGTYLHITGTTTITAFDTVAAGIQRTLEFTGALTLTNGTAIILQGGANITTAAGDTAEFISEGSGNWRCIDYTRAASAPSFTPTIRDFSSSGSDTIPVGATRVRVIVVSAGAGGGSGRRGAAGTIRCGGGGASGGGFTEVEYQTSDIGVAGTGLTITVGTGGAGGAAVTANDTDGNPGNPGGSSSVKRTSDTLTLAIAGGSTAGPAGSTSATNSSVFASGIAEFPGGSGGGGSTSATATAGGSVTQAPGGGGGGGGIDASDVERAGGAGGTGGRMWSNLGTAPAGGNAGGTNNGTAGTNNTLPYIPGSGGGGGGANKAGVAGSGGNGATRGGGGGGGGASLNGSNSGAGGNGVDGFVRLIYS